jgi:hypothetical protein
MPKHYPPNRYSVVLELTETDPWAGLEKDG